MSSELYVFKSDHRTDASCCYCNQNQCYYISITNISDLVSPNPIFQMSIFVWRLIFQERCFRRPHTHTYTSELLWDLCEKCLLTHWLRRPPVGIFGAKCSARLTVELFIPSAISVQERRSDNAIKARPKMNAPSARVVRYLRRCFLFWIDAAEREAAAASRLPQHRLLASHLLLSLSSPLSPLALSSECVPFSFRLSSLHAFPRSLPPPCRNPCLLPSSVATFLFTKPLICCHLFSPWISPYKRLIIVAVASQLKH